MPPEKKESRRYKVVGAAPVIVEGKRRLPGETFSAALSENDYLIQAGAVKATGRPKKD